MSQEPSGSLKPWRVPNIHYVYFYTFIPKKIIKLNLEIRCSKILPIIILK
jgi:hypothetical protein